MNYPFEILAVNDNGILKMYKTYIIPIWYDLYRHSNTLQISDKCEILEKLKYSKFLSKHLTKSRYLVISVVATTDFTHLYQSCQTVKYFYLNTMASHTNDEYLKIKMNLYCSRELDVLPSIY